MEIDLWCQAEVCPSTKTALGFCPRPNRRAVCFENASKEAAQAESDLL